ncbi:hypothetical protein LX32DRAFT_640381 [Colletotrichum zoysiae]|uniref:Uncharacterized protein n=1 Tax=Colletotrichum zoysiae TaxID=1216348 RepID=A0AAD9HH02_9PEZI|nr:hypothetical protein LX32DRAFT_640381 [Colletotrichum zoysiae]
MLLLRRSRTTGSSPHPFQPGWTMILPWACWLVHLGETSEWLSVGSPWLIVEKKHKPKKGIPVKCQGPSKQERRSGRASVVGLSSKS